MIPYIICLLPAFILSVFYWQNTDQLNIKRSRVNRFCQVYLLPLAFLIAFKSVEVGADTRNYNRMFNSVRNGSFSSIDDRIEEGYLFFLKIITKISSNPQVQYIAVAILFIIIIGYFMKKNAVNPGRFIVMFLGFNLFSFYLTGIRQTISMMICICAYDAIKEKKFWKFLLIVAIATTFHKAALFFLPAYIVANGKLTKNKIYGYVLMFGVLAVTNEFLFESAGMLFDIQYGIEKTNNGYVMVAIMAVITILSFIQLKRLLEINPDNIYLIQLNILHTGFWILRLFSRTAERPSMYYTVFTILLVEQLILSMKKMRDRQLVNFLVMAFFAMFFIYKIKGSGLVPYHTIFWQS